MAKRKISSKQSAIDAALLTYGKQEALFILHKDNEELLIDNSKKVPEISLPAIVELKEVDFDNTNKMYDINVAKIIAREVTTVATGSYENHIPHQGGFSLGFSLGFNS